MLEVLRAGVPDRPRSCSRSVGPLRATVSRRFARRAVVCTSLAVALLGIAHRLDPLAEGLTATYYPNTNWTSPAASSTLDSQPSTEHFNDAWNGRPPAEFSSTWSGSLLVQQTGQYTFSTISDDGSWVYVDGALVVDNGGRHGPQAASGSRTLERGVHSIFVRYVQQAGDFHFELLWGPSIDRLARVPASVFAPHRRSFGRFLVSVVLRRALALAEWLWISSMVMGAVTLLCVAAARAKTWLEGERAWPTLRWILAGSVALNVAGIWWGLPRGTWAGDELLPYVVVSAAARRFSHGWFEIYPPLHYYILAVMFSPAWLLLWLGRIDRIAAGTISEVIGRFVSVGAGTVALVAVYACGARAFSRRAGLLAAAVIAVAAPFVYYAKTANVDVPYLCWFALALLYYLRMLEGLKTRDFAGFAAFATLSICTKDQAYGLYLLVPVVAVHRLWQANRASQVDRPLRRAVFDPRLAVAGAIAVAIFVLCHNWIFNWRGFVGHVRFISTSGIAGYRMFEPTIAGRTALLGLTIDLVKRSSGWPLFLASVAGLAASLVTPRSRRVACWLIVPLISYYLGFVNVILYNYDRFVLPISLVAALFAGLALDRWLSAGAGATRWKVAGLGVIFAYSALYAASVDVLMIRDSRYDVEQWMAAHVDRADLVGFSYAVQYLPRLDGYRSIPIGTIADLRTLQPAYYVVDADYARSEPPGTATSRMIEGIRSGSLGYRLAYRFRRAPPWPWLPGGHPDLVGPRSGTVVSSSLRHINPMFEVYRREG